MEKSRSADIVSVSLTLTQPPCDEEKLVLDQHSDTLAIALLSNVESSTYRMNNIPHTQGLCDLVPGINTWYHCIHMQEKVCCMDIVPSGVTGGGVSRSLPRPRGSSSGWL